MRSLPTPEREVEQLVMAMLDVGPVPERFRTVLTEDGPIAATAPAYYQPFLPVPLWADAVASMPGEAAGGPDQPADSTKAASGRDPHKRRAARREPDQAQRRDPFILNRVEKILALADMVNVNRPSDNDDEEDARKAADDLDELTVSRRQRGQPATRLKFDLDLSPEAIDRTALDAEFTYPEWDYTRRAYLPNHCRVLAAKAGEEGERWTPDEATRRQIRRVRRQFEALRPKRETLRAQIDGDELDIDAMVRSISEIRTGGTGSERVYLAHRPLRHDLAVALLVDVSLSTDAWVDGKRVLDIEKEALLALAHGIAACGDNNAILTFTSRRRSWVKVDTVKDFDEPMDERVARRISALKPDFYTRMGAAIRHASSQLSKRPNRKRLLLILTDGKPNDVDHYEGRFGIEDTRRAILEARQSGVCAFGVTVDRDAKSYFPTLFGRGGYAILNQASRLPAALPAIYRELVR